jgi:hypothetical protein
MENREPDKPKSKTSTDQAKVNRERRQALFSRNLLSGSSTSRSHSLERTSSWSSESSDEVTATMSDRRQSLSTFGITYGESSPEASDSDTPPTDNERRARLARELGEIGDGLRHHAVRQPENRRRRELPRDTRESTLLRLVGRARDLRVIGDNLEHNRINDDYMPMQEEERQALGGRIRLFLRAYGDLRNLTASENYGTVRQLLAQADGLHRMAVRPQSENDNNNNGGRPGNDGPPGPDVPTGSQNSNTANHTPILQLRLAEDENNDNVVEIQSIMATNERRQRS